MEETVPVSYFGLYLSREWNEIFVQCFADNRGYDAIIEIQRLSNQPKSIKVEVTTTDNDSTVMRRQALSRNGFANFTGSVKREKRNITTEGEFVDSEEESEESIKLALQRLENKLNNQYDNWTAILVYITGFKSSLIATVSS